MNKSPERGFILLDVLLALVVLAGAILVTFQALRSSLRALEANHQFFRAALLLEDHVGMMERGENSEEKSMDDPILGPVTWEEAPIPTGDQTWHRERARLAWGQGSHAQSLELSTPIPD